jgi:hypothetical protein
MGNDERSKRQNAIQEHGANRNRKRIAREGGLFANRRGARQTMPKNKNPAQSVLRGA